MKTTIEIADALLVQAKRLAREQDRTLRDVVEDGLRKVLAEPSPREPFKLVVRPFHGTGLQAGVMEGDWAQIRDMIYESPSE